MRRCGWRASSTTLCSFMDSLTLSVLTPHSYAMDGCQLLPRECMGLTEYMRDLTGRDHGLPPTEAPLRAVPLPLAPLSVVTGRSPAIARNALRSALSV
jgi:hypothetical protein